MNLVGLSESDLIDFPRDKIIKVEVTCRAPVSDELVMQAGYVKQEELAIGDIQVTRTSFSKLSACNAD